eukprot:6177834-Pleurochrysis_carterae.AAC.6
MPIGPLRLISSQVEELLPYHTIFYDDDGLVGTCEKGARTQREACVVATTVAATALLKASRLRTARALGAPWTLKAEPAEAAATRTQFATRVDLAQR